MIEAKLNPEQRRLVDELVDVRAKCLAWRPQVNPHAARFEELNSLVLSWFEKNDPAERIIAKGNVHTLPISPRDKKRTIVLIPKLLKRLGQKWIVENFRPTLKSLEKALTPDELKTFVTEERSGPRTIGEPVLNQAAVKAA